MIIAATGHRPDKLGGYAPAVQHRLQLFAHACLVERRPQFIISGMALGWDQAVALGALLAGIPFIAAVPFAGQERAWPETSQRVYKELLAQAARVYVVCPGSFAGWKMQKRNEWMVDRCDSVLALWNGSAGGTANCVAYADTCTKPVDNVWEFWAS